MNWGGSREKGKGTGREDLRGTTIFFGGLNLIMAIGEKREEKGADGYL